MKEKDQNIPEEGRNSLSLGKLILLPLTTTFFSFSILFSFFSPLPLSLGFPLYGRKKIYSVIVLTILVLVSIGFLWKESLWPILAVLCAIFFSFVIGEVILARKKPMNKIATIGGFIFFLILGGFFFTATSLSETGNLIDGVVQFIENHKSFLQEEFSRTGEKNFLLPIQNPEQFAIKMLVSFPGQLFVGVVLILWANLFLAFRFCLVFFKEISYHRQIYDLLNFHPPFFINIILAIGLFLTVISEYVSGYQIYLEAIGLTIVYILGVFYFFNGVGVLLALLNKLKIYGLLLALVMILLVFFAKEMFAIIGLLDQWINFRGKLSTNSKIKETL